MAENIWEEEEEFRDTSIAEGSGEEWVNPNAMSAQEVAKQFKSEPAKPQPQQQQPKQRIQPDFSHVEEVTESIGDDEDDFSAVFSDANLRLEQGSLYKLIMKHDLFEGSDADPKAIQNVQRAIRKFAKEQMEIMLGMRQERAPEQPVLQVAKQFNSVEEEFLKQLAYKGTQGKSAEAEDEETVVATPKRMSLNTIGGSPKKVSPQSKPVAALKTQSQPIKRTSRQQVDLTDIATETANEINRDANGNAYTPEAIKRALDKDRDYVPLSKPIHELTPREQAERMKQTQQRLAQNRRATNPQAMPMPSYEQQEAMAISRANAASGSKSLVSGILANLNKK